MVICSPSCIEKQGVLFSERRRSRERERQAERKAEAPECSAPECHIFSPPRHSVECAPRRRTGRCQGACRRRRSAMSFRSQHVLHRAARPQPPQHGGREWLPRTVIAWVWQEAEMKSTASLLRAQGKKDSEDKCHVIQRQTCVAYTAMFFQTRPPRRR